MGMKDKVDNLSWNELQAKCEQTEQSREKYRDMRNVKQNEIVPMI